MDPCGTSYRNAIGYSGRSGRGAAWGTGRQNVGGGDHRPAVEAALRRRGRTGPGGMPRRPRSPALVGCSRGDRSRRCCSVGCPTGPAWLATARGPHDDGRATRLPRRWPTAACATCRCGCRRVPGLLRDAAPDVAVVSAVRRGGELAFGASVGIGPAVRTGGSGRGGGGRPGADPTSAGRRSSATDRGDRRASAPAAAGAAAPPTRGGRPRDRPAGRGAAARPGRRSSSARAAWPTLSSRASTGRSRCGPASSPTRSGRWPTAACSSGRRPPRTPWGGAPSLGSRQTAALRLVAGRGDPRPLDARGHRGFVACNTAVQVGLDGAVNVERVGGRQVAGIGGHADFCAGASRAPGGISVIALRSTTRGGAVDDRASRGGRARPPAATSRSW